MRDVCNHKAQYSLYKYTKHVYNNNNFNIIQYKCFDMYIYICISYIQHRREAAARIRLLTRELRTYRHLERLDEVIRAPTSQHTPIHDQHDHVPVIIRIKNKNPPGHCEKCHQQRVVF